MSIQRPEYILQEFSSSFRFSNYCIVDTYQTWQPEERIVVQNPYAVWKELFDQVCKNTSIDH